MRSRNRIRRQFRDNAGGNIMATIKDISRRCGVSPATVSKALNGYTDISRETVELVRRTAREMHYMPNAAATPMTSAIREDPSASPMVVMNASRICRFASSVISLMKGAL